MNGLAERIKAIEANGLAGLSDLMADVKANKVALADIKQHYALQYAPQVRRLMTAWQDGRLFGAQTESWGTFLSCANLRRDRQAWLDFQADFWMAGVQVDKDVALFAYRRILAPDPSLRAAAANGAAMAEAMRQQWVADNARHGWSRWGAQG